MVNNKTVVVKSEGQITVVGGVPQKYEQTMKKMVEIQHELNVHKTPSVSQMSMEDQGDLLRSMTNMFMGR